MAIAIDASSPAKTSVAAAVTTTTTGSFSPPANSIIVLCIALNGAANTTQSVSTITDSLTQHLGWARLAIDNIVTSGFGGCSTIWYAPCPSAQTSMTITLNYQSSTSGSTTPSGIIMPVVLTGAAMKQTGNTSVRNTATTATPSQTLVTQFGDSLVFSAINNWTNSTTPVAGTAQTLTINGNLATNLNATDGDGYWVQVQTAVTPNAQTTVTNNDTAPTTVAHHHTMVEIMQQQPLQNNYQFVKVGNGMSVSEKIR